MYRYIHRNLKLFHTQWRPRLNSLSVLYRGYDLLSKHTGASRNLCTLSNHHHCHSPFVPQICQQFHGTVRRRLAKRSSSELGLKEAFNFQSARFRKPRAPLIDSCIHLIVIVHAFWSLLLLHLYHECGLFIYHNSLLDT